MYSEYWICGLWKKKAVQIRHRRELTISDHSLEMTNVQVSYHLSRRRILEMSLNPCAVIFSTTDFFVEHQLSKASFRTPAPALSLNPCRRAGSSGQRAHGVVKGRTGAQKDLLICSPRPEEQTCGGVWGLEQCGMELAHAVSEPWRYASDIIVDKRETIRRVKTCWRHVALRCPGARIARAIEEKDEKHGGKKAPAAGQGRSWIHGGGMRSMDNGGCRHEYVRSVYPAQTTARIDTDWVAIPISGYLPVWNVNVPNPDIDLADATQSMRGTLATTISTKACFAYGLDRRTRLNIELQIAGADLERFEQ
nr:hypothetical protein CFP56_79005 [Quercus suber]